MAALVLVAAFVQAGATRGQTVAADWVQKPTNEQIADAYPAVANSLRIHGRVILACGLTENGVLRDCRVEQEAPKGLGFGRAAESIIPYFRMRPTTVDGRVRSDLVRIPLRFVLPQTPAPPFQPGPPTSARALELARQLVEAEGMRDFLAAAYGPNSPTTSDWQARNVAPDLQAAAVEAQQKAFSITAPAWTDAEARIFASVLTEQELAANLTFAKTAEGQSIRRNSAGFNAAGGRLSWQTFRLGLALGRDVFCDAHACLPTAASPKTAPSPPPTMLVPDWLETPASWQVTQATPFLAMALSMPGEAHLRCRVAVAGTLEGCAILHETPAGIGFGAAALEMAKLYRARPLPAGATGDAPTVEFAVKFAEFPMGSPPLEPQPTIDPNPGEARLSLGRKLVAATDLRSDVGLFNTTSMTEFDSIPSPGVDATTRSEVRAALVRGAELAISFYEAERAKHYAGLFTEAELTALLAWESTPAAKARRAQRARMGELDLALSENSDNQTRRLAGRLFCATRGCAADADVDPGPPSGTAPKP